MDIKAFNLGNLTSIAVVLAAAFIAALWLGIIFWVIRDIRSRSRDPLMFILSLLLVIVLFIPGVLIYRIIRPGKTFEEKYQAALEEEALLQEMERQIKCPSCGKQVRSDWIICPNCHTKMKKKCISCGGLMELQWNICPYCGEQQQKPYNASTEHETKGRITS